MALQYVIYNNPSDYPNKFVVRKFLTVGEGTVAAQFNSVGVVDSIEEARALVPKEYNHKIARLPQDEPQIAEVWMTPELGAQIEGLMASIEKDERKE